MIFGDSKDSCLLATTQVTMDYEASTGVHDHGLPNTILGPSDCDEKLPLGEDEKGSILSDKAFGTSVDGSEPTEEEKGTLRKVAAPMPFVAIAMCLIEFAERASESSCTLLCEDYS